MNQNSTLKSHENGAQALPNFEKMSSAPYNILQSQAEKEKQKKGEQRSSS